ncbi:MAG TPA: IS110 family transposase [Bacteroidia bacterium]|nr:IS110 family transposase [Bacteroidia bacterium]
MNYSGIDISAKDFWVSSGGNAKSFAQSTKGYNSYLNWLGKVGRADAVSVMEATGVYHLRLAAFLRDKGLRVAVVNPQRPYHHGRSQMARVVNDSSAARNIEDFAIKNSVEGNWVPMPDEVEQLRWWLKEADHRSSEITKLGNRVHSLKLRPSETRSRVEFLEQQILDQQALLKKAESEADALASKYYREERELFRSIPGIGAKTSMALVAFFCSHYEIANAKQALVLAGLSLKRQTSGTSIHKKERITKMGYAHLRKCLYMAALTAVRENPACKDMYEKLVDKGKKKKVALIAVACKLLRQAFAVWNTGMPFNAEKSKGNFERILAAS